MAYILKYVPCILKYMACIFYEMPYVFSHIGKECAYKGHGMQNWRVRMRRSPCVSREIYFFMISLLTRMQSDAFISPITMALRK